METPEPTFSLLSRAIESHMKGRANLEDQLRKIEGKASLAERELTTAEKEYSTVHEEGVVLREKKQLLLTKLETINAKNDRLQRLFDENRNAEHELEGRISDYQAQMDLERNRLNGEFLKLQNPIFTELGIRQTTEFDFPVIDVDSLKEKRSAIQGTL